MPTSVAERKHLMPFGGQKEAAKLARVGAWYVSLVMARKVQPQTKSAKLRFRRTQIAIARVFGLPVEEVFDEEELSWGIQRDLARSA